MPITFGAWLRDKIKAAGLSNAEVARRSGYSDTHIGNLLRDYHPNTKSGHGGPSVNAVEKIARAVGADLDEARLAAGYAPLNEIPVLFHNEDKLTDEERVLVQQIINRFADAHIEDDE